MNVERFRVKPGTRVRLSQWDPDTKADDGLTKETGTEELTRLGDRLAELQEMLYVNGSHRLLVVLQGMDTSGKDGTIKQVFQSINPAGVSVASFKRPSEDEVAHDYLWRIHQDTPAAGQITIFNRSHYEDVLVVRVHGLVPESTWKKRYAHINDFERLLTDEGTAVRKFFLHISKDEQRDRLQARLDDPSKQWKFNPGDLGERERWDDYQQAYEAALSRTSTEEAPWYVIPANRKWSRNLLIAQVLIEALESLDLRYPDPPEDLDQIKIR